MQVTIGQWRTQGGAKGPWPPPRNLLTSVFAEGFRSTAQAYPSNKHPLTPQ